jgi:hypothetical protein
MSPTPRPWKVIDRDDLDTKFIRTVDDEDDVATADNLGDARLIVHAVNMHDSLVDKVKQLLHQLSIGGDVQSAAKELEAVIAKEGE